jgi:membrane-bound inhibitor of C-type lysozyme
MHKNLVIAFAIIIILVALGFVFTQTKQIAVAPVKTAPTEVAPTNTVQYMCTAGKSITAAYYLGISKPAPSPDQPPIPGGSVKLTLSDGREITLPQSISADGARYATTDESIVFWSKGRGLTFTEAGQETFTGCIEVAANPGTLSQVYENSVQDFSIRYPSGFTTDESYSYEALGPGKSIAGVKFTIDPAIAQGTNLGPDSYVSLEEIPNAKTCSASLFVDKNLAVGAPKIVTENDTTYSTVSTSDAGAGNRYEETIYALPGRNPCIAVRYFIHYGVFENYPTGTIKQFDETALKALFGQIRDTLVVAQ